MLILVRVLSSKTTTVKLISEYYMFRYYRQSLVFWKLTQSVRFNLNYQETTWHLSSNKFTY